VLSPKSTSSAQPLQGGADVSQLSLAKKEEQATPAFTTAPADLHPLKAPSPESFTNQETQKEGKREAAKAQNDSSPQLLPAETPPSPAKTSEQPSSAQPPEAGADVPPLSLAIKEEEAPPAFTTAPADLHPLKAPSPKSFTNQETQKKEKTETAKAQSDSSPPLPPPQTPPSPAETPSSIATSGPSLFVTNLKESSLLIYETVRNFIARKDVSTPFKVLAVGGPAAVVITASSHSASAGLGAAGFILCNLVTTLENNRHARAQCVLHGIVLGGHFMMGGNEALAATSAVFGARMLTHSMIPQSFIKLNIGVTLTGMAVSSMMFCCAANFSPGFTFQNAPLAATFMSSIASTLDDRFSWITRLTNIAVSSFMLPYHLVESGSPFLAALAATMAYGFAKTMQKKDLPKIKGIKFSISGWWKALSAPVETTDKEE
jgi:hypothetical protein